MQRRNFLKTASLGLMAANLSSSASPSTGPNVGAKEFKLLAEPVLLNASHDSVTVLLAVSSSATGWIEFGETKALGLRVTGGQDGMHPTHHQFLRIRISGLKPGTRYYYRAHVSPVTFHNAYKIVRGAPVQSAVYSFQTLNPEASTASFTCWNDTHEVRPTIARLSELLRRNPTDFLCWNGDVTNDILSENQLTEQFLNPVEGPFASSVPLFFGRGNHDTRGAGARSLSNLMSGPNGSYFYAFRQGPMACVVLDTGEDKPDETPVYAGLNDYAAYRSEQAQWLSNIVQERWFKRAAFRVAFLHIPLIWEAEVPAAWEQVWGTGIKGWICEDGFNKWHPYLVKGKVDVVISGHIHRHHFFPATKKRPYAQLIGGGPQAETATAIVGRADRNELQIEVQNLAGNAIASHSFKRS